MTKEEKRQRIIEAWKATGYLDGLKSPSVKELYKLNGLFGSFGSHLINEVTPLVMKVAQESIKKEKQAGIV